MQSFKKFTYCTALACLGSLGILPAAGATPHGGMTTTIKGPTGHVGGEIPSTQRPVKKKSAKRASRAGGPRAPRLKKFRLSPTGVLLQGGDAVVRYKIDDRDQRVKVRITIYEGRGATRRRVLRKELGARKTGTNQASRIKGPQLAPGTYRAVLSARDRAGHKLKASGVSRVIQVNVRSNRFPVANAWTWGGDGAKFGAPRSGHTHMGYDILAPKGSPVVAPVSGRIKFRQYQKGGAGHYLILDGDDGYDYAFMHLVAGSPLVSEGDPVAQGQQIAQVGSTGRSTGPHLHFEMWQGEWWEGGKAIDPEPFLRSWAPTPPSP